MRPFGSAGSGQPRCRAFLNPSKKLLYIADCPIAHGGDGYIVDHIHDAKEYWQRGPFVGHDPVNFIGHGQLCLIALGISGFHGVGNKVVPLARDQAFRIVVVFLFTCAYQIVNGALFSGAEVHVDFLVALKQLDGVEPKACIRYTPADHVFNILNGTHDVGAEV